MRKPTADRHWRRPPGLRRLPWNRPWPASRSTRSGSRTRGTSRPDRVPGLPRQGLGCHRARRPQGFSPPRTRASSVTRKRSTPATAPCATPTRRSPIGGIRRGAGISTWITPSASTAWKESRHLAEYCRPARAPASDDGGVPELPRAPAGLQRGSVRPLPRQSPSLSGQPGVNLLHQANWVRMHPTAARAAPESCSKCHDQTYRRLLHEAQTVPIRTEGHLPEHVQGNSNATGGLVLAAAWRRSRTRPAASAATARRSATRAMPSRT